MRRFIKEVQPPFLSYDHYPIVAKGKEGRDSPSLRPFFYDNIEQCHRIAQENNLDLWAFCMTTPHYWPARGTGYPPPTEGHLRLQIYTDLAYGARALQYFTYWTPAKGTDPGIEYYSGPIDTDGKRTPTFDLLKKINQLGTTVILATHDRDIVNAVEKRVITLDRGRVIRDEEGGRYILV